jgi:uncharacterized peroxidase-related enzyme
MPRLKITRAEEAEGDVKAVYDAVESKFGMLPNLIQGFGTSPVVLKAYATLDTIISEGALSPAEREIVRLVVSQVNQCTYCLAAHTLGGQAAGLSRAELLAVRKGESENPRHAALAAFTKSVVEKKGFVADAELEAFRTAGYQDSDVGEIVAIIAQKTISNYFNHIHETELDFPPAPEI